MEERASCGDCNALVVGVEHHSATCLPYLARESMRYPWSADLLPPAVSISIDCGPSTLLSQLTLFVCRVLAGCRHCFSWIAMLGSPQRAQLVWAAGAGLLVVCATLVAVQRSGTGVGTQLLSHHGGHNKEPEDVSLKLRKVPGAGYASSSVEGLRAKALLKQAKVTASKGMEDLEAASAAHLEVQRKSKQLQRAIEKRQKWLADVDGMEHDADKAQDVAASSLLQAKGKTKVVAASAVSAEHANLEAHADSSEVHPRLSLASRVPACSLLQHVVMHRLN